MLGYMSKDEALILGFTHHGAYYGIPVYLNMSNPYCPEVACKWEPMEFLMDVANCIESLMHELLYPDDEPSFQFTVKGEIDER